VTSVRVKRKADKFDYDADYMNDDGSGTDVAGSGDGTVTYTTDSASVASQTTPAPTRTTTIAVPPLVIPTDDSTGQAGDEIEQLSRMYSLCLMHLPINELNNKLIISFQ